MAVEAWKLPETLTIAFGPNTTLGYAANAAKTGGSLSIGDGAHLAQIALLGQYAANSFVTESDGHGGTRVSEAQFPTTQQTTLTQPHQT